MTLYPSTLAVYVWLLLSLVAMGLIFRFGTRNELLVLPAVLSATAVLTEAALPPVWMQISFFLLLYLGCCHKTLIHWLKKRSN